MFRRCLSLTLSFVLIFVGLLTISTDANTLSDNKLRLGITSFPTNANPWSQSMQADNVLQERVYSWLTRMNDRTLEMEGDLAENWEVSEDGLVWTISLKKNVIWHDGEKFDADDVIFTYQTLLNSKDKEELTFRRKKDIAEIEKIEKIDDYTVKMTCSVPKAYFTTEPLNTVRIVPEHIWSNMTPKEMLEFNNENPIGTGPFKLKGSFNPQNNILELERNDGYFDGAANIDSMIYILFENKDTMYQAFINGDIDAFDPSKTQVPQLEGNKTFKVMKSMRPMLTQLGFNCWTDPENPNKQHPLSNGNPLLLNPNIRRAFDYSLDKQKLVDMVLGGVGNVGSTLVPTSSGKWHLDIPHEYNPDKAIELLEAEGFTSFTTEEISGREVKVRTNDKKEKLVFRLALLSDGYAWHYRESMPFMAKWLEEVGIGIVVESMDGSTLGEKMKLQGDKACDFDLYIWGWTPGYEPSFILSVLTTDQIGGRSDCMYSNEEYDRLYELQLTQINEEERLETINQMQKIILEEAPYISLYYQGYNEAYRTDKFEGWVQVNNDGTIFNNSSYLEIKPVSLQEKDTEKINEDTDKISNDSDSEETPAKDVQKTKGPSSNPILWIVIIVVVVGFIVFNKKDKR
ncbi:ABC transporter substrate-binding protein [Maledivibacter halophilus]|uniref:Extracellular solute-binding protein, family 5 Middle n=1 Tax=Maledivibacter halophilus TaxID=36842 RepID=A0A1T5IHY4_9FIRM|nr:ABC transporter substrate-binding protein [Maledivibacter halophilus]SKC38755.1 extracellular solute-binding protein, family 5 Middle [Maledivibacter halophilus]